jgi:hypothetical protein
MLKIKYKFNPETLTFEAQKNAISEFLYKQILPKFASSVVLGIALGVAATYWIGSPAEHEAEEINTQHISDLNNINKKIKYMEQSLAEIQNRDDNFYRAVFQEDPISSIERLGGFGGTDRYDTLRGYEHSTEMIGAAYNLDKLSNKIIVQSKSFKDVTNLVINKEKMLACIPSIQPIAVKDLLRFGSPFGFRFHPILNIYRMHAGVDLSANEGVPIYATGNGTVVVSGVQNGYGNVVKINHGFGYMTVYGHCSKLLVKEGDKVKRGDIIALVGSTGLSTAPHCHYEVRVNGVPQNPLNFYKDGLSEAEYQMAIESSYNFDENFED